ncbi:hypothetical protein B5K11_08845 [Rhizobium leguminosarum bv. trifolii]|nr:hypothetical protein B5K11_08845 [Rhizobium leguminosarum bv. trifolii]
MSTTLFVAELVRAANEADRLGPWEAARLLERAIATVRELREAVGIPKDDTELDGRASSMRSRSNRSGYRAKE